MISLATLMSFSPIANAQQIIEIETHAYIMLSPKLVGVNQDVVVTYRLDKVAAGATIRAGLFNGTTVTITRPDGTTETKGPLRMDSTSAGWFVYVPTAVGAYTFQTNFPEHWINGTVGSGPGAGTNASRHYLPSTSAKETLTVQQNSIPSYPSNPLPTGYWTRPINAENKGWWQIADNWLMVSYDINTRPFYWGTAYAPYTSAPNSPHVLWKKPIWFGGLVGGRFGDKAYYTGLSYEQFYQPLILNGRIIYLEHGPTAGTVYGTRCLDLYTGEEIYYLNGTTINFAQTLDIETGNEHGLLPYLWSTQGQNWLMFDAFTGRQILNVTGMPTASAAGTRFGPNGEILVYVLNTVQDTFTLWNSTRAVAGAATFDTWSPAYGGTINASRPLSAVPATAAQLEAQSHSPFMGVEWNVTVPNVPTLGAGGLQAIGEGYALIEFRDTLSFPYIYEDMAVDLNAIKRDATSAYPASVNYLWLRNRTDVYSAFYRPPWVISDGSYALHDEGNMQVHVYSIQTGEEKFVTEALTSGWGIFTYQVHIAMGKLYTAGFDGYVRAYDIDTGQLVWDYYFGDTGYETPYGTLPVYNGYTIADNKLYITNDEHSPDSVMWRGGRLWAIDANTGEGLWNVSGWMRMPVISDGVLTSLNVLDGQVYTIGKGPSKTTVSMPQTAVPLGQSITVTGTVTDESPGQRGTPAISDESMAAWMEYLHMQKPKPVTATGVKVSLKAIDPNGATETISDVISDTYGNYGVSWTPKVQGLYQIIAEFAGTESYGSSAASAYVTVGPAAPTPEAATPTPPPTTPPVTATPTPTVSPSQPPTPPGAPAQTELYIIAGAAVAIIAIAAVAALVLRRRK